MDYKLHKNGEAIQSIVGYRNALNNWLRQFTTVIDPVTREFNIRESLLGVFKWGKFAALPKIDYVLIFKSSFVKCESCSIEEHKENPFSYFQVSLVYRGNRRIIVHETKNRSSAFDLANLLSSSLKVKLKDSASFPGKSVWLN